jgi:hypothetical protein
MPSWKLPVGWPSLPMPRLPVATPRTAPSSAYSPSAAAKPGKISTPRLSACSASHLQTAPRLMTKLPWLWKQFGISHCGVLKAESGPRNSTSSAVTGCLSGAPRSFQSGNSSFIARGSITAPLRMCAPGSEPFSSTTTDSAASICLRRIAVARPAGPAPTITTSYSMLSRGPCWARMSAGLVLVVMRGFVVNQRS